MTDKKNDDDLEIRGSGYNNQAQDLKFRASSVSSNSKGNVFEKDFQIPPSRKEKEIPSESMTSSDACDIVESLSLKGPRSTTTRTSARISPLSPIPDSDILTATIFIN